MAANSQHCITWYPIFELKLILRNTFCNIYVCISYHNCRRQQLSCCPKAFRNTVLFHIWICIRSLLHLITFTFTIINNAVRNLLAQARTHLYININWTYWNVFIERKIVDHEANYCHAVRKHLEAQFRYICEPTADFLPGKWNQTLQSMKYNFPE